MDWKKEAATTLRDYPARKSGIDRVLEQLEQVAADMTRIRSAAADSIPVSGGGGNRQEDALVGQIMKKGELEKCLASARAWCSTVDKALEVLTPKERRILDLMYVHRARGNVELLCEELHVEKSRMYELKDDAMRRFTLALYGCLDT